MSILEPALAQKFIDKTAKHLEYNINIMNEKGIIIASKDTSRVGNFHEVAYDMLNGTLETGIVKEEHKFIGTKPGVNLFIDYKNKHVGVICVTGNPDNVYSFAGLVKTSMEAMLEYEIQMEGEQGRKDKSQQFLYYLLFEENADIAQANAMADELRLKKDILRVCILIKHDPSKEPKIIIDGLINAQSHSKQDIITIARNDDIIVFKAIDGSHTEAIRDYRCIVNEFYNQSQVKSTECYDTGEIAFYVGTMQEKLGNYRASYSHAQELRLYLKQKEGIYFFNDYIINYYRSLVTMKNCENIFHVYQTIFSEEEKKQMVEMVEVLSKNNYNVVNSAKALYIHRNTLLFRLNKIKGVLNIDPIANAADREFLNELSYYFSSDSSIG